MNKDKLEEAFLLVHGYIIINAGEKLNNDFKEYYEQMKLIIKNLPEDTK